MKYELIISMTAGITVSAAAVQAQTNNLYIAGDQPYSLTITQDEKSGGNTIGSAISPFKFYGSNKSIAISQVGFGNSLSGGIAVITDGGNANTFSQEYKGSGYNEAIVNIGDVDGKLPKNLSGLIVLDNDTTSAVQLKNTLSETTKTDGDLVFDILVKGKGNKITDILDATSDVSNIQKIYTDGNTISNTITGATKITIENIINDNAQNSITTNSTGLGNKTIKNTIKNSSSGAAGHLISIDFGSTAQDQSSILEIDGGQVDFKLESATLSGSDVYLKDVRGSGVAAKVGIFQTVNAAGSSVNLTVTGNGRSARAFSAQGKPEYGYAVYIKQDTANSKINANIVAKSQNYNVYISQ